MAACRKWACRSAFDWRVIYISKCSVSSLPRFSSAKESDDFWLQRFDHKDWLPPNEVLKVLTHLRDPGLILDAFKQASACVDYKTSETLYSLLIDKFTRARKFNTIEDLVEKAKQEKCRLSDDFFYRLIKIYGNEANNLELAIKTLYRMPEFHCWPTVKTFNCVLNMLVCNKQFEVVHDVFLSASRLGVALDTCCFNILIKGLCKWDKLDDAFSLLDEIPKHGRRPNAATYSTLMHALCKHGRVDEAFELFEKMEKAGCYPDTVIFNVLISGLCNQGRASKGMELLKAMQLKGCCPNSGTYQALLYGLLRSEKFVEAKDFMFKMVSEGFNPSFLSYKLAIDGLCNEKLLDDIDQVLKQMLLHGFIPQMGTWSKIVRCIFHKRGGSSPSSLIELMNVCILGSQQTKLRIAA